MNRELFREWHEACRKRRGVTDTTPSSDEIAKTLTECAEASFEKETADTTERPSHTQRELKLDIPGKDGDGSAEDSPSAPDEKPGLTAETSSEKPGGVLDGDGYELKNDPGEAEIIRLYTALKQRHDQLIISAGFEPREYDEETAVFWNTVLMFHLHAREGRQNKGWIRNRLKDNCFSKILDEILRAVAEAVLTKNLDRFADVAEWRLYRSVFPTTARPLVELNKTREELFGERVFINPATRCGGGESRAV